MAFNCSCKISISIALFLILFLFESINSENCEKVDYSQFKYRGSTTNYDDVRGHQDLSINGCQPQKIWAIFRHGIRHNHKQGILEEREYLPTLRKQIVSSYYDGKGNLCEDDINALNNWVFDNIMPFEPHHLTVSGRRQLKKLGERMRKHFPSILNATYDPKKFYFAYSGKQRTLASLRAFTDGVFEYDDQYQSSDMGIMNSAAEYDCSILKILPVEFNYEVLSEALKFAQAHQIFEKISKHLSIRTGISRHVFNKTLIWTMHNACAYESANDGNLSPWCRLFTKDDYTLMELRERNAHYAIFGGESQYASKSGCAQIKSLLFAMNDTVYGGKDNFKMEAIFGHDAVMEILFTRLGCFKLGLSNWDLSRRTPFAANLLAVLYRCDGTDNYKLQFYLNETPLGCCLSDSTEPCSWNQFLEKHSNFALSCIENYCTSRTISNFKNFTVILLLISILITYISS